MADSHKCQVLLVDPDQSSVDIVRSVLVESNSDIHSAAGSEQAIDIFASQSIDIVITELNLAAPENGSGISGLELMNRLSLVDHSVKVIFFTEDPDPDSEHKALSAGAFAYIRKPIHNADLLQHVATRAYEFSKLQRQNQNLLLQLETTKEQLTASENTVRTVKRKFRRLAITDSLTNLYNRRFVEQTLQQEVNRRNRYKTALSLVFIDVDGFTPLCQEYGHEISNFILKDIARLLLQCSRTTDFVARFATDVFVILLPETTPQNALIFAERVRTAIDATNFDTSSKQTSQLTVCIGVSGVEVTSGSISEKQLTVAASKALHTAKSYGPDHIRTYPEAIQQALKSSNQHSDDNRDGKAA